MALDFGFAGAVALGFEGSYGTSPTAGAYKKLPVLSINPGISQPYEAVEVVGGGREGGAMLRGLETISPNIEMAVDLVAVGYALRAAFGGPETTGTDNFMHVFSSGATGIPSLTVEAAAGGIGDFQLLQGCRVATLDTQMQPGQVVQSLTLGLVGRTAAASTTSVDPDPEEIPLVPLSGSNGVITRNGGDLGFVTGATLRFSNNLDQIRAANASGVAVAEPGLSTVSGSIDVRLADRTLLNDARGLNGIDITFGWKLDDSRSLQFRMENTLLERTGYTLQGRAGTQASFSFVAQPGPTTGCKLQVTLKNQYPGYAS